MPLSIELGAWSRPVLIAAVLAVAWLWWPVGLAVLAYLVWTGRLAPVRRAGPAGSRPFGNPFDRFWRHVYRIEPAKPDRTDGDPGTPSGSDAEDFTDYLERLRRAQDSIRIEPAAPGRDRAGFA